MHLEPLGDVLLGEPCSLARVAEAARQSINGHRIAESAEVSVKGWTVSVKRLVLRLVPQGG